MVQERYDNKFIEYRKSLASKEWFLKRQSEAWKAAENMVGHQFSNTAVFLAIFLLGGLSVFLFIKGTQLQQAGETFWGGILLTLIFLTVAICVYLVSRLRKRMGAVIFHAYVIDEITRTACLEEIDSYEYALHQSLDSLSRSIKLNANKLRQCDYNDTETVAMQVEQLIEYSEMLQSEQKVLSALRSERNSYYRGNLYDSDITNAVIEHHK